MGDPNQSLMQYQDQAIVPQSVDPSQVMSIQPPPPLPILQQAPTQEPPQDWQTQLLNKSFGPTSPKPAPAKEASGQPSLTEDQIRQMVLAKANEEKIAREERQALAAGLMKTRVVGPSKQQLEMATNAGEMSKSVDREAADRQEANQFAADTEIRRREAYANFQEEENAKRVARQNAINSEIDERFAKVDAMSDANTDHFWKSREAGARARAIEAVGGWRASNDIQAVFMHNPGGANASNAAFDMYKDAINQDVALQMKNRDFAAGQLKERIAILGSREAAELSLRKEKFDAMAAKWDALAAQAKDPEARADNEVIARKAMAASQALKMDMVALTAPHVTQEVDKRFYLNNLEKFRERPEVVDTLAPQFGKQVGGAEKGRAEIGKIDAEASKASADASGTSKESAEKVSAALEKAKIPENQPLIDKIKKIYDEGEGAPGIGMIGRRFPLTAEARENKQAMKALVLMRLHKQFGARLTQAELNQHADVVLGTLGDAKAERQFMKLAMDEHNSEKANIEAGNPVGAAQLEKNKGKLPKQSSQ